MTQAFNLAQLANNLNTSGQLDATDGLNGLVANANLASSGSASSSTYLRGDRTWASLPALGKILQVNQTLYTASFATTSNAYVDVYSVAITPSSSSSRILLLASVLRAGNHWNDGNQFTAFRRGGAEIFFQRMNNYAGSSGDTANNGYNVGLMYVDSPGTTSSVTYNVSIAAGGNSGETYVNRNGSQTGLGYSSIIAMEIAP